MRTFRFSWLLCVMIMLSLMLIIMSSRPKTAHGLVQRTATPSVSNFDAGTQNLIATADRVVFLIPFSHWDTDWHDTFDRYSQLADQNIAKAIGLAKQYPRFRYTLEQVLFVQHFWGAHPEFRDDLKKLVQSRQITFAWAGITQPETSLVAPSVQVHNLQLGEDWIAETFGVAALPHSAWQSDAFGNSAAFPTFLSRSGVLYLYIGRWQGKCDPDYQQCQPLPPVFYWRSPSDRASRVLVTYLSYETAWADIYHRTDPDAQLKELRNTVEAKFKQTSSKYLFLPVGFDFADPQANLPALVERWNAADPHTALVMADPASAFQYLATQRLPEITTDLNPIWQAFYDTRPAAKIADKETEYYLTAADKFGLMVDPAPPVDWNLAAMNAHYDNIGGVSFDAVWNSSQKPRYEQTLAAARSAVISTLTPLVAKIPAPLVIFNPTSWPRSEVVEWTGNDVPDRKSLPQPVQQIGTNDIAFRVENAPPLGYLGLNGGSMSVPHPVSLTQNGSHFTLTNGLILVTLDADHGGAFSSLALIEADQTHHELLKTWGDDVTYFADKGDVYGASFGAEQGRESTVTAQITILAAGPLLARAQIIFTLGNQTVVKTITVRADDPLIEVGLDIATLPNTTALSETSTILDIATRTDDLGFGALSHAIDTRPIVPGDVTYRRSIFYPVIYWSDVSTGGIGLTVITHGLQGVAGGATRAMMLVRDATIDPEGVSDPGVHHLHYGFLPHFESAAIARPWLAAYAFNQPLILATHVGDEVRIQLPFDPSAMPHLLTSHAAGLPLPMSFSLLTAQNAVVADLYRQADHVEALIVNYDPTAPATLQTQGGSIAVSMRVFDQIAIPLSAVSQPTTPHEP